MSILDNIEIFMLAKVEGYGFWAIFGLVALISFFLGGLVSKTPYYAHKGFKSLINGYIEAKAEAKAAKDDLIREKLELAEAKAEADKVLKAAAAVENKEELLNTLFKR